MVMTTEVLRNMLYAGSGTLAGLGYVVMDEVHYLADRSRGAVWEEVIIHLPDSVALVSLSATVSNAEEFGEWLETVRGDTDTLVEERRPVPLYQHVLVGKRMMDLFATSDVDAAAGFVKEGAPVNAELLRIARDDFASTRLRDRRTPKGKGPQGRGRGRPVGNGRRVWIPSRVDVLDQLDAAGLLPAIVFIFSRVGCDAAVQQCLRSGIRLTTPDERDEIHAFVEEACADLPDEDRQVLGYHDFLDGLRRGVAAHHAGMLPAFKQCVEQLFVRGLCKAVFATETLALGINMPARTVVLEKLSKWNGETHADITPGEYTQLTGRAGRRGLDVEGPRGRPLAAGDEPERGRRPGVDADLPAPLQLPPVVQHGGQPGAPGRPAPGTGAAGDVVRPVPGRQGRGRARATADEEPGRPAGVRRVGGLRPRRLHGVRRHPPPRLRAGEGCRACPQGRPSRGGAALPRAAPSR